MSNEDIIQECQDFVDKAIEDLSDQDYMEVLFELSGNFKMSAECNNLIIGRASQDIDQKRVGDILGFTSKEQIRALKYLKPGEVYCEGSAFEHSGVEKFMVGDVNTIHPDRTKGIIAMESSPTPENIKKLLKDIVDLPKEAEEELRTTQEMKNKIKELKTKLTISENAQSKPLVKVDEKALERAFGQGFKEAEEHSKKLISEQGRVLKNFEHQINQIGKIIGQEIPKLSLEPIKSLNHIKFQSKKDERIPMDTPSNTHSNGGQLRAGAMKILGWLAGSCPNYLTKQRIATLSGFSVKGGTFNTYISELKRNGWIIGLNELSITGEGLKNAEAKEIPSGEELLNLWKEKFRAGAAKILQLLYDSHPNSISKEEIGYSTGFEPSGGTFNTYLSELRRNGLIEINGNVKISNEFFE